MIQQIRGSSVRQTSIMRLDEAPLSQLKCQSDTSKTNPTKHNQKQYHVGLPVGADQAETGPNSMQKFSLIGEAVKNSMSRFLANVNARSSHEPSSRSNNVQTKNKIAANPREAFASLTRQHPLSRSMESKSHPLGWSKPSSKTSERLPATSFLRRSMSVQQAKSKPPEASRLRQSARKCCDCITNKRFPWTSQQQRAGNNLSRYRNQSSQPKWLTRTSWVLFLLIAVLLEVSASPVLNSVKVVLPVSFDDEALLLNRPNQQVLLDEEDDGDGDGYGVGDNNINREEPLDQQGRPVVFGLKLAVEGKPEEEVGREDSLELEQQLGEQSDDSLWVQRRRLERDRALEPPSWLRNQPMRRASIDPMERPAGVQYQTDSSPDEIVRLTEPSTPEDINSQVYEEIKLRLGTPEGLAEEEGDLLLSSEPNGQMRVIKIQPTGIGEKDDIPSVGQDEGAELVKLAVLRKLMKRTPTRISLPKYDQMREDEEPVYQVGSTDSARADATDRFALSRERLALIATRLKSYLEDLLGIPRSSILGLYPLNEETLLIRLNLNMLNRAQLVNMVQNYDFARGFVGASWPVESKENPMPLVRAILRAWVLTNPETLTEVFDQFENFSAQQQQRRQETSGDASSAEEPPTASELNQALNAAPAQLALDDSVGDVEEQEEEKRVYILREPAALDRPERDASAFNRFQEAPTPYRSSDELLQPADRLLLAEYLNALYATTPIMTRNPTVVLPSASFSNNKLPQPLMVKGASKGPSGPTGSNGWFSEKILRSQHLVYLFALMAGLLGTGLAVKLVIRGSDKHQLRRQFSRFGNQTGSKLKSIWSRSESTISGEVASVNKEEPNQDKPGDLERQRSSKYEDNLDSLHKNKSLEMLTQRLVNLLKSAQASAQSRKVQPSDEEAACQPSNKLENHYQAEDEDDQGEFVDCEQRRGHFRSSRSYIKSLIDVLSNARSHISSVPTFRTTKVSESYLVEDSEGEQTGEPGIVASQMDISAAHLILAYMERHLEDKERLRLEWQELNGHQGAGQGSSWSDPGKVRQLMLQRLAKVALCEENKPKNRNLLVVPFDRNRVRLFHAALSRSPSGSSGGSRSKLANKRLARADYINASYIHDDDIRKPTHIIAQGPLEETAGQFWQMIWEQGISVIVMLTRLNENGQQACHCYWPTNAQPVQVAGLPATSGSSTAAEGAGGNELASRGRRGSVTSVFDSPASLRSDGSSGQPIISNGEPSNNMLVFDISCESSSLDEEEEEEEEEEGRELSVAPSSSSSSGSTRQSRKPKGKQATGAASRIRFEIHLVSEHVSSNDYLVRNMYIINRSSGETRTITQFHYLAWPMDGVPSNAKSLLAFRRKVHKSYRDLKSPILVHGSQGAGRSGTYTLIDIILERIKNGAKEIDPRATLEHLRDQRVGLCSTRSQFEFVLVALAEEIQIILNALPR